MSTIPALSLSLALLTATAAEIAGAQTSGPPARATVVQEALKATVTLHVTTPRGTAVGATTVRLVDREKDFPLLRVVESGLPALRMANMDAAIAVMPDSLPEVAFLHVISSILPGLK